MKRHKKFVKMILRVFLVLMVMVDATMAWSCFDGGNPNLRMNWPACIFSETCYNYAYCIPCTTCTFPKYEVSHCDGETLDNVCAYCPAGMQASIDWSYGNVFCQSCPTNYDSISGGYCCAKPQHSSLNGCEDCSAGYVIVSVKSGCGACPQGSFEFGHIECLACPAGKYNDFAGQNECVSVTLGLTYQDETGQRGYKSCRICFSGTYISSGCTTTTNTVCSSCGTGTYQDTNNQIGCKQCPSGTITTGTGKTSINNCSPCPVGTFETNTRQTCSSCSAGFTYQDATGQSSCKSCTICSAGQFVSTACSLSSNTVCTTCKTCTDTTPYKLENSCTGLNGDSKCVSPVNHTSNSTCHFNVSIYIDVLYTTLDDYTLTAPRANSGQFYVNGTYTKQKQIATLGVPFNWGLVPGDDNYVEISDFIKANHPAGTFYLADNSGFFQTSDGNYFRSRIITNDTINGYRPETYPATRILMQHRSCSLIFNDLINNYYWTTNCGLNNTHCNKCSTCSNNTFQSEACNATTDTKCSHCTICTYNVITECTPLQDTVCSASAIQRPILFTVDTALGFLNPSLTTEGNATFGFPILQRPASNGFGTLTATLGAFKLTKKFNSVLPTDDLTTRKFSFTRASSGNLTGPLYFDSYSTQGAALATLRNSEITRKWNHGFLVLDQYGYAPTYTTITMTVSLAFTNSMGSSCDVAVTTYTSGNVDNSGMANVEVVPLSTAFLSSSTCAFYSLSATATVAGVATTPPSSLQNFATGTVSKTYGTTNTLLLATPVPNLFTPNVNDLIVVAPTAAVFPGETINLYFYIQSSVMLLQGQVSIFLNSPAYTIGTPTYPSRYQVIPNEGLDTTFKQNVITSNNGGNYTVSFKRENADKSINGRQPEPCLIVPLTIVAQEGVLFRDIGLTIRVDYLNDASNAFVALRGSPTYSQFANCYSRSTAPTIGQCNGTPTFRIQNNYPVDVLVTIYDGTFVDPWFTNTGYFTGLPSSTRTLYTKEYFMQGSVGSVAISLASLSGLTSSFTCENSSVGALTASGRRISFATTTGLLFHSTDSVTWSYTATFASTTVASRSGSTRFFFWQPLTISLKSSRSDLRPIYYGTTPWQQSDPTGCVPYYESSTLALIVNWTNTYNFPWNFNGTSGVSKITDTFVTDVIPFITGADISNSHPALLSWDQTKNILSVNPSSLKTMLNTKAYIDIYLFFKDASSATITIRIQHWAYNSNRFAKVTKLTVNLICGICDLSVNAVSRVPGTNSVNCNEKAGSSVAISSVTPLGASASNGLFTNQGTFASFNAEGVYYMVQQFQNASALVNMVLVNSESDIARPDLRIEGSAILNLSSLNPTLLTADSAMGYFQAQNRGDSPIAKADVLHTCGTVNGQSFISGTGLYDGRLSSPVSGTIIMNGGQFLGAPYQPPNTFAPGTYPTSRTFTISLTFANPTYTTNFNNDARTTFNSSNTSVFTVNSDQQVTAVGPGTAILFITTLHPIKLNFTVIVVAALALTATSVPTSNAGTNNNELVLSPLGNSGKYQQASLSYSLSISNGGTIPIGVVTLGDGVYLTLGGALTQSGSTISVNTGNLSTVDRTDGTTLITAQIKIGGVSWQSTSTQYTIDASNKFLAITSVTNLAFTNFVAGVFGAIPQPNAVKFDLAFADETKWIGISYNTLPNTVSFSCNTHLKNSSMDVALGPVYVSSTTGPASCDATTGNVTIFASSFRFTTLTVTTYNNYSTTLDFATNLKPPNNDAAFSNLFTSVPIATNNFNAANATVAVPLYLNLAGGFYVSFNLFVTYDPTRLYVGAGKTVDTSSICETYQVNEDAQRAAGILQIACLAFYNAQSGSSILVSTITFQRRFTGPELFKLGGYFDTLSTSGGSVVTSGTPFKAGKIVFAGCLTTPCQTDYTSSYSFNGTTSLRRRRSISNDNLMSLDEAHIKYRNRRTIDKVTPNTCNGTRALNTREQGDINGDCRFDADDYTLAAKYLQGTNLSELQRSMFDQDRNGLNNSIDLILIGAALTSQAAFMSNLRISSPLKSSGCAVTIELDFEFLHNTPVSSGGAGGLAVFLDFETQTTNGFSPLSLNSPNEFQNTCDSCLLNSQNIPNATDPNGGSGMIRQFPKLNGGTVTQTGCSGGLFEMKFLRTNPLNGTSTFQLKLFSFMATQQIGITPYTIAIKNELDNTRLTTNNEQIRQFPFYGPNASSPFLFNCKLKIAESPIDNSWKDYLNNTFGPKYPGQIDKTGPGYDPLWIFGGNSPRSRGKFAARTSPECSGLKCNCEIGYYIASDCESNAGLQCTQCSNCSANEELKVPCDGTKTVEVRECAITAEHIAENFCREFTVFFQGRLYATLDDINPLLPRNNSGQNTSLNLPANWGIAFDNISYLSAFASINQFGAFYLASTSGIYSTLNGTWYPLLIDLNNATKKYRPNSTQPFTRILLQHIECANLFSDGQYYLTSNCSMNNTHCQSCRICDPLNQYIDTPCTSSSDTICKNCNGLCSTIPLFSTSDLSVIVSSVVGGVVGVVFLSAGIYFLVIHYQKEVALNLYKAIPNQNYHLKKKRGFQV